MKNPQWKIPRNINDSNNCFEKYIFSQDEVPAIFCSPIDTLQDSNLIFQIKQENTYYSESFLHRENINHIEKQNFHNSTNSWTFFILFFSLLLLIINLFLSFSRFKDSIKAAFSIRETGIFIRNYNIKTSISSLFTYINTYILYSLLILLISKTFFHIEISFIIFIIIFIALLLYQLLKTFLFFISEKLFDTKIETAIYIYRDLFIKNISIILLTPFLFATIYSPFHIFFLFISIGIAIYLLIHQLILSIITGYSDSKYSFLYFILYFCSVEILPLLIGAKLLMNSKLIIW